MLDLKKREDGWWITNTPAGIDEMGPYDTKAEAEEDVKGCRRFIRAAKLKIEEDD